MDDGDRFGNENIVSIEGGYDSDNQTWTERKTYTTVRQLAENAIQTLCKNDYWIGGYTEAKDLNSFVKFLEQKCNDNFDGDGGCFYQLESDAIEQENRQRMLKLEKQAVKLMQDNPDGDLFEVLTNQIEIAQDSVDGLAEDGLCAVNPFSSSAHDDYNDLRCGLQGKVNAAYELLEYCEKQFPLQWLAFKEKQANEQLQLTR